MSTKIIIRTNSFLVILFYILFYLCTINYKDIGTIKEFNIRKNIFFIQYVFQLPFKVCISFIGQYIVKFIRNIQQDLFNKGYIQLLSWYSLPWGWFFFQFGPSIYSISLKPHSIFYIDFHGSSLLMTFSFGAVYSLYLGIRIF